MADISVSSTAIELTNVPSLIQNLGTGILYVDIVDTVTSSTGVEVAAGDSIPVGGGHTYYGVSAGTSDVRVLPGGMGSPSAAIA